MKKVLLFIAILCCLSAKATDGLISRLDFSVGIIKGSGLGNQQPKDPTYYPEVPEATLEENVLTFESAHDSYTLVLINENNEVAYEVTVPSSVSVVVFPATLTGDYELQLDYGGNFYFYCDINL